MEIQISNEAVLLHLASAAGASPEQYVNELIKQAADLAAIREGYEDVKAGRVRPLAEFDEAFRKKQGFAPRSEK